SGPTDQDLIRGSRGAPVSGEVGLSLYERISIRPALTVTGLEGGHTGSGTGAIVPHAATAKLNIRLVPDQVPREVAAAVRAHVLRTIPPRMHVAVRVGSSSLPVSLRRGHPVLQGAVHACRKGF